MQKELSYAICVITKAIQNSNWQSILLHTTVRNHSNAINVTSLAIVKTVSIIISKMFTHRKNSNAINVIMKHIRIHFWRIIKCRSIQWNDLTNAINVIMLVQHQAYYQHIRMVFKFYDSNTHKKFSPNLYLKTYDRKFIRLNLTLYVLFVPRASKPPDDWEFICKLTLVINHLYVSTVTSDSWQETNWGNIFEFTLEKSLSNVLTVIMLVFRGAIWRNI